MKTTVKCPSCKTTYSVDAREAGYSVPCKCGERLSVPAASAVEAKKPAALTFGGIASVLLFGLGALVLVLAVGAMSTGQAASNGIAIGLQLITLAAVIGGLARVKAILAAMR